MSVHVASVGHEMFNLFFSHGLGEHAVFYSEDCRKPVSYQQHLPPGLSRIGDTSGKLPKSSPRALLFSRESPPAIPAKIGC